MPTVLRVNGYRFFFYSADCSEPAHIHVERGTLVAKFWLNPITLSDTGRFRQRQLNEIRRIIEDYQSELLTAWAEHCE